MENQSFSSEGDSESDNEIYFDAHKSILRDDSFTDKRAHHNALERRRRDHIKDSFWALRDSVPSLMGEKSSRSQILNKATEYIKHMRRRNAQQVSEIETLRQQNSVLDQQVQALEQACKCGNFKVAGLVDEEGRLVLNGVTRINNDSYRDDTRVLSRPRPKKRPRIVPKFP